MDMFVAMFDYRRLLAGVYGLDFLLPGESEDQPHPGSEEKGQTSPRDLWTRGSRLGLLGCLDQWRVPGKPNNKSTHRDIIYIHIDIYIYIYVHMWARVCI